MNKEDMDRHDIIARRDEGIALEESYGCHKFDHTNEAVCQGLVEGPLPSCTNTCK